MGGVELWWLPLRGAIERALWHWELKDGFALPFLLADSDGYALPSVDRAPLRFTAKLPFEAFAINAHETVK